MQEGSGGDAGAGNAPLAVIVRVDVGRSARVVRRSRGANFSHGQGCRAERTRRGQGVVRGANQTLTVE